MRLLIITTCLSLLGKTSAQDTPNVLEAYSFAKSYYITWGYNRSYYRDSDIHFKGHGFDFTLFDVDGRDDPEPLSSDVYWDPLRFTVPQFNFRAGYYLNEFVSASIGWDHMKYVMRRQQILRIAGRIETDRTGEFAGEYDGVYVIGEDMLRYELTDGLNFVRAGIERRAPFASMFNDQLQVDAILGASIGVAMPWADTRLFGTDHSNWLHLAGWGASGILATRCRWRKVFLQYQMQVGHLSMHDILIEDGNTGRASQNIWFTELSVSAGVQIGLGKKARKNRENLD